MEISQQAISNFSANKKELLPADPYFSRELMELHEVPSSFLTFQQAFSKIDPNTSVHEAAKILALVERRNSSSQAADFLKMMELFVDFESHVRFSLWPDGNDFGSKAPHHFSKLLNSQVARNALSPEQIICILAIFADPKGLNLRNAVCHGFCFDTSLAIPLMEAISNLIFPIIPPSTPPPLPFDEQIEIFKYHSKNLSLPCSLRGLDFALASRFPLLDSLRLESMKSAYELFSLGKFRDSLLHIFPILEHSLRRAVIATSNLEVSRLEASTNEHFLSVQDCCNLLPPALSLILTDLLFAPRGPRLRDRLMHGGSKEFPYEFTFCVFVFFERLCTFFDGGGIMDWRMAFHPARVLEFYLSETLDLTSIDLMTTYNSETFESMVDGCKAAKMAKEIKFKESDLTEFCKNWLDKFINLISLCCSVQAVKKTAVTHILTIAHAAAKFGVMGCGERFKDTVISQTEFLTKYLPIENIAHLNSIDSIEAFARNSGNIEKIIAFAREKTAQSASHANESHSFAIVNEAD